MGMSIFLLHWSIYIFMVGLLLALPLGAVYYLKDSPVKQFFSNPRKLKAAHLDYITQAFSIGLVYLLELGMNTALPLYAVIPLAYGTFCNPFIFLLEATPLYKDGFMKHIYRLLKATSPTGLFFAWFMVVFQFLPGFYFWLLMAFVLLIVAAFAMVKKESNQKQTSFNKNM
jgi:hypothetical protein